jgi:hypothetical protein
MAEEVFISYGSADRERIQDLVTRLPQAGVTVWTDEASIKGAAMWSLEIVSTINNCNILRRRLRNPSARPIAGLEATRQSHTPRPTGQQPPPNPKPSRSTKTRLSFCRSKISAHRARTITSSRGSSMISIS